MPFYYKAADKDSKFAIANCYKWDDLSKNANVVFTECKIEKLDDGYQLFMFADYFVDLVKSKDDTWKFEPQLITFVIHNKEFDKREKVLDEWKTVKVQPSETELFWCRVINQFIENLDAVYSGGMVFSQSDAAAKIIFEGINARGQTVSEEVRNNVILDAFYFDEVAEPKLLAGIDIKKEGNNAKKSWGGGKSQTEKERLNDRWEFIKLHCDLAPDVLTAKGLSDLLLEMKVKDQARHDELLWIIKAIMQG